VAGDDGLATDAQVCSCGSLQVLESTGDVYYNEVSKSGVYQNRIRKIRSSDGKITTVVGDGTAGNTLATVVDGIPATQAKFKYLSSFSIHENDIYVADTMLHMIRKVDGQTGLISTFAGTGYMGMYSVNFQSALSTNISTPNFVKVSENGDVYFMSLFKLLVVRNDSTLEVIAGTGNLSSIATATSPYVTQALTTPISFVGLSLVGSEIFALDSLLTISKTSVRWISPEFTCFGGYDCGNGYCESQDVCKCDTGYSGTTCNVKNTCFGTDFDDNNVCGGHGVCVDPDSCNCNGGWFGSECVITTCFYKYSNDSSVCSGHGTCSDYNSCTCQTGYSGNECDVVSCGGVLASDANVCSGHGTCTSLDTCSCTGGYSGAVCNETSAFTCFGTASSSQSVCSGRGSCTGTDTCTCNQHSDVQISGQQCETLQCKGTSGSYVSSSDISVCHGRGTCSATGCTCQTGYNGTYCQNIICFNVDSSNAAVCGGHGTCASPDTCTCHDDTNGHYGGQDCSSCKTGFTGNSCLTKYCDPVATCNGHGTCNGNSDCVCSNGFLGTYCDQCQTNYYGVNCTVFCENTSTCSNHGACAQDGSCTCDESATNGFWSGSSCNACKVNFYGSDCKTGFVGPIQLTNFGDRLTMKIFAPSNYTSNSIPCDKLLSAAIVAAIGKDAQCVWTDKENGDFEIIFGEKPTFTSGTAVSLNTQVFSNAVPSFTSLNSIAAANPEKPVVVSKTVKKQIGSSEDVTLDGSMSYSGDSNDLIFNWVVVQSASNGINTVVNNQVNEPIIVIPSSALTAGTYKIELTVTSQLTGLTSDPIYFDFEKKNLPLPIVSFNGNPPVVDEKPITLKMTVEAPTDKPTQEVTVEWTQTQGPTTVNEKDQFNNLVISNYPSGSNTYTFTVKATDKSDSNIKVEEEITFETKQQELELNLYVIVGSEGLSVKVEG